jgi:hypothetical protein
MPDSVDNPAPLSTTTPPAASSDPIADRASTSAEVVVLAVTRPSCTFTEAGRPNTRKRHMSRVGRIRLLY